MKSVYKSAEGERAVRERYSAILKHWPVPNEQLRIATRANSSSWMGDVGAWAQHFRVYAVDIIGDAGLSAPSRLPLSTDAHRVWLDDVLEGLAVERTGIVGVSLRGWLALDYSTRRPERVSGVAVLCPGGVGRQKVGIVF